MNLKKTVLSLFAAVAMVGSMLLPAYAADVTVSSTAGEDGSFISPYMTTSTLAFPVALVQAQVGDTVESNQRWMVTGDSRAYSPGWTISMDADDFTDGNGHVIEIENLSVSFKSFESSATGCTTANPKPDNPYGTMIKGGGTFGDSAVTVLEHTPGRGCSFISSGVIKPSYIFTLNVPPATYTGGHEAVYTTTMTLTTQQGTAPTAPAAP